MRRQPVSLQELKERAADCRDCPLWERATQTVFGDGRPRARVMLVGEQPGDEEDKQGRPFVGPAGRLLDQALADAGIDRGLIYVTNAVKHFSWEPRGKRRIHKTPAQRELDACYQWLEGEIASIGPRLIVCLGATAAKVLLGATFRITHGRGQVYRLPGLPEVLATFHPSYLLRLKDQPTYAATYAQCVDDLKLAGKYLHED